jgi:hypothetical protein
MSITVIDQERYIEELKRIPLEQRPDPTVSYNLEDVSFFPKQEFANGLNVTSTCRHAGTAPVEKEFPISEAVSQVDRPAIPPSKAGLAWLALAADILEEEPAPANIVDNPLMWVRENVSSGLSRLQDLITLRAGDAIKELFSALVAKAEADIDENQANTTAWRCIENAAHALMIRAQWAAQSPNWKAVDIYRTFVPALKMLSQWGFIEAKEYAQEASLEQTLPLGEVDAPSWIDSYTGERYYEEKLISFPETVELTTGDERFKTDLGWDDATIKSFFKAQEGFNDTDEPEVFEDDHDTLTPAWDHEFTTSNYLPILRSESWDLVKAVREQTAKLREKFFSEKDIHECSDLIALQVNQETLKSELGQEFLGWLKEEGRHGADPIDLAVIFLGLEGWAFKVDDVADVRIGSTSLANFIVDHEDALLDLVSDGGLKIRSTDLKQLNMFCDETFREVIQKQATQNCQDATRTPEFVTAELTVLLEAKDLMQNGHNLAASAGWEAWRESRSHEANVVFHEVLNSGKSLKEAMQVFKDVIRATNMPGKPFIVSFSSKGMTLSSGRKIDWRIAALKFKGGEIDITDQKKADLKHLLLQKGWGNNLLPAL